MIFHLRYWQYQYKIYNARASLFHGKKNCFTGYPTCVKKQWEERNLPNRSLFPLKKKCDFFISRQIKSFVPPDTSKRTVFAIERNLPNRSLFPLKKKCDFFISRQIKSFVPPDTSKRTVFAIEPIFYLWKFCASFVMNILPTVLSFLKRVAKDLWTHR